MSAFGVPAPRYRDEETRRERLLRVDGSASRPSVAILGRSGQAVQRKTGELSEDGKRCTVRFEGAWVDATRTLEGWVFNPYAAEVDDEA